jgi:hypothetical protein
MRSWLEGVRTAKKDSTSGYTLSSEKPMRHGLALMRRIDTD